jgi:DDE superfamily endonuclease
VAKRGLTDALRAGGLTAQAEVLHADELRLGLRGQVRRVLAPKGVDVRQRVQLRYEWVYLLLGVDARAGTVRWRWLDRMRAEYLHPVLMDWQLDGVVWDGAGAHRSKQLHTLPTVRVVLPPYSPELNPAERLFQEIRRRVEGRVYDTLAAKQAGVETYLAELATDPTQVKRLCGWAWVVAAVDHLPPHCIEQAPS